MTETFICSRCGAEHPVPERIIFGGYEMCQNCYDTETCVCDRCGDRIWAEDSCGDEDHTLCRHCEDNYYDRCSDCGRLVEQDSLYFLSEDDTDGYCNECYEHRLREGGVHGYCYKPEPIFYGDGPRYLGVELEIDRGGESHENAIQIQRVGNKDQEHIYIKHDGSLDKGLEIVTHPMTLGYHQREMPWEAVIRKALDLGYISHQAGTCGLHVHVNRSSLGSCRDE